MWPSHAVLPTVSLVYFQWWTSEDTNQCEIFAQVKETICFYGVSFSSQLGSDKLLNNEAAQVLEPKAREGEEKGGGIVENKLPGKI